MRKGATVQPWRKLTAAPWNSLPNVELFFLPYIVPHFRRLQNCQKNQGRYHCLARRIAHHDVLGIGPGGVKPPMRHVQQQKTEQDHRC